MVQIRQNDPRKKKWIQHRNKKNLIRRTEKRENIRCRKPKNLKQDISSKRPEKDLNTYIPSSVPVAGRQFTFTAPEILSIMENSQQTTGYFNTIINIIKKRKNRYAREKISDIYIDLRNVQKITIEAIMYLIAIMVSVKKKYILNLRIMGNFPKDSAVREYFLDSGFLKFVDAVAINGMVTKGKLQILSGEKGDTEQVRAICDYVNSRLSVDKKRTKFLFAMLMELMTNTYNHAYRDESSIMVPKWYVFIEDVDGLLKFTFLDTGFGLIKTITKSFYENINILLRSESELILSAFSGVYRSSTKVPYRGKGLPKINKIYKEGHIQNLNVISSKGRISGNENGNEYTTSENMVSLIGTVYYWEINKINYEE